jgi:23S rRNA pseudouridine1911/1915/1917 synthase
MKDFEFKFITDSQDADERLDQFLKKKLGEEYSRTSIQSWIENEYVTFSPDYKKPKASLKLIPELEITLRIQPKPNIDLSPVPMDIPVLWEEEDYMIINKPRGISTHPGPGDFEPSLVHGLLFKFKNLSHVGGEGRPGIVHRLDKLTSGLMVIAKTDRGHLAFSKMFHDRNIEKIYNAWCHQTPKSETGTIDQPIGRHKVERIKMMIDSKGRKAVTHYKIERIKITHNGRKFSLIEARIETGRTHQIRVHFQANGFPIVGDPLYSSSHKEYSKYGLLLYSKSLRFEDPFTKKEVFVEVDTPENLIMFDRNIQ